MGIYYHPSVLKSERCVPLQSAEGKASFVCQCCKAMSNSEQAARHFRKQATWHKMLRSSLIEATMQTISTESSVGTNHMAIILVYTSQPIQSLFLVFLCLCLQMHAPHRSNRCSSYTHTYQLSDPIVFLLSMSAHACITYVIHCYTMMYIVVWNCPEIIS